MLLNFRVKNYRTFRDQADLNLRAEKITEGKGHLLTDSGVKTVPTAVVFGPNGSGKSNLYKAFDLLLFYVKESAGFSGGGSSRIRTSVLPFLADQECREKESVFEAEFTMGRHADASRSDRVYWYGFAVKGVYIIEEWLYSKARTAAEYKRVFHRSENSLLLSGELKSRRKELEQELGQMVLLLSLGAQMDISLLARIYNWFSNSSATCFEDKVGRFVHSSLLPDDFDTDIEAQNSMKEFLNCFDKTIAGFEVEKVIDRNTNNRDSKYRISVLHKMQGTEDLVHLPLQEESQGTLKLFSLYAILRRTLKSGGVLYADGLDAYLHPLLAKKVVELFADPAVNKNKAQLIFNGYDVSLMGSGLLRRDEIWFLEKEADGASRLYSLAQIKGRDGAKIRKDENYEKNYLAGKYGAVPESGKSLFV